MYGGSHMSQRSPARFYVQRYPKKRIKRMSKKHYEKLAALICKSWKHELEYKEDFFVIELMDILEEDNPEFNRKVFLKACKG
jgi:hypothetical protein